MKTSIFLEKIAIVIIDFDKTKLQNSSEKT